MTQISASIPEDLKTKVQEIATDRERSFSEMVSLLLRQAVNEIDRQRKKRAVKDVHS